MCCVCQLEGPLLPGAAGASHRTSSQLDVGELGLGEIAIKAGKHWDNNHSLGDHGATDTTQLSP